jgi:nitrite reductase (NADH) small subunit
MTAEAQEVCLGPVDRIPPGEGRAFVVEDRVIAVFRQRDGAVYAADNACPHQAGPLAEGIIGACQVICPMHGWKFDLASGACLNDPEHCIRTYPTRLVDGQILVATEAAHGGR